MNINPQDLIPPAAMQLIPTCKLCGENIQGGKRRHVTVNVKQDQGQLTLIISAVCEMCALTKPYEVAAIGKGTRQPKIITNLN